MLKVTRSVFLLCLAFSAVVSCKPNHQYLYENFEVSSNDPSCSISLNGSEHHEGRDKKSGMSLSRFRSPYIILVSFHFPKEQSGIVELKEISFSTNGSVIERVHVGRKKEFDNKTEFRKGGVPQIRKEDESRASFLIKQITIPHSKQKVLITAVVSTDQGDVEKTWEFELTPVVEEELRNDQLDSVMSV